MLWQILVQFLFRLGGGLSMAMLATSPRDVTAGFFRVHLWVVLGLNTFVAAVVGLLPDFPQRSWVLMLAIAGSVLSYVGAVTWLYERARPGQVCLSCVTAINLWGAVVASQSSDLGRFPWLGICLDVFSSAAILGTTFAAMLLGHWYLNTPTMKLDPLKRLILLMAIAVLVRSLLSFGGLAGIPPVDDGGRSSYLAFLALRWLAGLLGVLGLAAMTWQTLKIPNTQSATGILYVAVIFVFLGELTAQLIAATPLQPV